MEKNEAYAYSLVAVGDRDIGGGGGGRLVTLMQAGGGDNPPNSNHQHHSDRTGLLTRCDVIADWSFGVHRKRRMARQRRSSVNVLPFPSFPTTTTTTTTAPHPPHVNDQRKLTFLFQKKLQNSDVGTLRRMVLPKVCISTFLLLTIVILDFHGSADATCEKEAETHLPTLHAKDGIPISMDDMDGLHMWSFKFRFWPNNNSRMYVLENTGEFVNTHGLRHGDYVMLYQDDQNQNYVIGARKASEPDPYAAYASNSVNDLFLQDFEVNRSSYFPVGSPRTDDDSSTSFVYDTTFSNESPLDFLGGYMTNYSRVERFGSLENLSIDDLY